jgi:hypothetical protein
MIYDVLYACHGEQNLPVAALVDHRPQITCFVFQKVRGCVEFNLCAVSSILVRGSRDQTYNAPCLQDHLVEF